MFPFCVGWMIKLSETNYNFPSSSFIYYTHFKTVFWFCLSNWPYPFIFFKAIFHKFNSFILEYFAR